MWEYRQGVRTAECLGGGGRGAPSFDINGILESFPFPASLTNVAGHFVAANRAFCSVYDLTKDEVIGKTPWLVAAAAFSPALSEAIQADTQDGGWGGPVPNQDRRGHRMDMYLITRRLVVAEGERFLGLACARGQEDGLMRGMMDLVCRTVTTLSPPAGLTAREQEVLALMTKGYSQKEAAYFLGIAPSTVRALLVRIRVKQRAQYG